MTSNSLRYQELQETKRHNAVMEQHEANVLAENKRHSLESEDVARGNLIATQESVSNQNKHNLRTYVETRRSNLAKEEETNRSNLAREQETQRTNLVNEGIKQQTADEVERHNREMELQNARAITESVRHNVASEGAQMTSASASYLSALTGQQQIPINQQNANTATRNANTARDDLNLRTKEYWKKYGTDSPTGRGYEGEKVDIAKEGVVIQGYELAPKWLTAISKFVPRFTMPIK